MHGLIRGMCVLLSHLLLLLLLAHDVVTDHCFAMGSLPFPYFAKDVVFTYTGALPEVYPKVKPEPV